MVFAYLKFLSPFRLIHQRKFRQFFLLVIRFAQSAKRLAF
jgi:hypothetical protein